MQRIFAAKELGRFLMQLQIIVLIIYKILKNKKEFKDV